MTSTESLILEAKRAIGHIKNLGLEVDDIIGPLQKAIDEKERVMCNAKARLRRQLTNDAHKACGLVRGRDSIGRPIWE